MATTSRKTEKRNLSKLSTESKNLLSQTRFVPVKENETKRRNNDLKSAVNVFNYLVDSNPTKELVEYFKEENEKSREHEKALMQIQCNMQLQMTQILSQSHGNNSSSAMPVNYNFRYGYSMTPPPSISLNTVTSRRENASNNSNGNEDSTGIFSYMALHKE